MKKKVKMLSVFFLIGILITGVVTGCSMKKGTINAEYTESGLVNLKGEEYKYEHGELDKRIGLGYAFTNIEKELQDKTKLNGILIPDLGYLFSYTTDKGLELMEELSNGINDGEMQDLSSAFVDYGILYRVSDKEGLEEEAKSILEIFKNNEEIGKIDGYTYYFGWNDDFSNLENLSEEDREDLKKLFGNKENFVNEACIFKGSDEKSHMKNFSTKTLKGQSFDNDKLKGYDLTMVNIWSTWCTGCVEEMPDLQDLYKLLPENTNMISICADGNDNNELALDILTKNNCEFDTLIPDENLEDSLLKYVDGFPTTIFVDKEGNIVGNPIMGVPGNSNESFVDGYLKLINERLELANE